MRLQSVSGKLRQFSIMPPVLWGSYVLGWLRRSAEGFAPVCFPGTDCLVWVPLTDFYQSYIFFCESQQGVHETRFLLSKLRKGDVLYDVGAFRGACGVAAKTALGSEIEVHLFEPLTANLHSIQTIVALNRLTRFFVVSKAVGHGERVVGCVNTGEGMLRLGDSAAGSDSAEFPSVTLDQYSAETGTTPTVIKVDVDGFEFDVLAGGGKTLESARPSLWIEVHPAYLRAQGRDWKELMSLLEATGYHVEYFDDYRASTSDTSFHIWAWHRDRPARP